MPDTYNDIDSGKLVNKSGLLELSVKIKEYVDNNSSSSSVELPFDVIEYKSTFANYSAADLQKIFNYGTGVAGAKPVVIKKDKMLYFFSGYSSSYKAISFACINDPVVSSGSHTVMFYMVRYTVNDTTVTGQGTPSISYSDANIQTTAYYNVSGTAKTLNNELAYIRDNFTKTSNLAAVALSNSYNDLDNKPTIPSYTAGTGISIDANNEISCTITDTNTTYTAGTGISITNGVISLDLPVANGVSY